MQKQKIAKLITARNADPVPGADASITVKEVSQTGLSSNGNGSKSAKKS